MYVELQSMLKNLCEDRLEGRKSVAEFLRAVSHNIFSIVLDFNDRNTLEG